jgi:hypothetical protein
MAQGQVTKSQGKFWVDRNPKRWESACNAIAHRLCVGFRLRKPTFGTLFKWLANLVLILAIASAPYWPAYFENETPEKKLAPYYFGGAVFLLFLKYFFTEMTSGAKRRDKVENHQERAALEQRTLFNNMLPLASVPPPNFGDAAFADVVRRTLLTILSTVKEVTDCLDTEYFQVSLLLFQPQNRIEVMARSGGPRAVNRSVKRDQAMAYYVAAQKLEWKNVPDLKRDPVFPFKGLSEPDCPYRSILFIPISYDDSGSSCAVIAIDSSRPYEFWGESISRRIFKRVIPFARLLAILLAKHPERV